MKLVIVLFLTMMLVTRAHWPMAMMCYEMGRCGRVCLRDEENARGSKEWSDNWKKGKHMGGNESKERTVRKSG